MKTTTFLANAVLALLTSSMIVGCSPQSSTMTITPEPVQQYQMPRPEVHDSEEPTPAQAEAPVYPGIPEQKFDWIYEDGGQRQLELKPQVDILFVVDNSDSMRSAQENLVKNISKFSDVIGQTQMIDYHIGVVSVWDYSKHFTENRKDSFGIGDLRFIKDSKGQSQAQRFVTRKESAILSSTLNIGVQALKDGGPEVEEIFAPLAAALDKSGNGAPNDGFFRPEAQLVVIFMTDADEQKDEYDATTGVSRLSVTDMYEKLVSFKGNDRTKVSAYGVLVPVNAPDTKKDFYLRKTPKDHPECFDFEPKKAPKLNGNCPAAFGPVKLEKLLFKINSSAGFTAQQIRSTYIKDITRPDFGKDLTEIGTGISKKTLEKVIELSRRPLILNNVPKVEVYYGTPEQLNAGKAQLIPFSRTRGWTYNLKNNTVNLSGEIKYQNQENARYIVRMQVPPLE